MAARAIVHRDVGTTIGRRHCLVVDVQVPFRRSQTEQIPCRGATHHKRDSSPEPPGAQGRGRRLLHFVQAFTPKPSASPRLNPPSRRIGSRPLLTKFKLGKPAAGRRRHERAGSLASQNPRLIHQPMSSKARRCIDRLLSGVFVEIMSCRGFWSISRPKK